MNFRRIGVKKNTLAKITFSILVLIIILFYAGLQEVLEAIYTLNIEIFLAAFSITIITTMLKIFRWKYIVDSTTKNIPISDIIRIYMIGFFFGTITPSKIGNIVKFHYLKKYYNIPRGTGISISMLDRIFDIIILVVFSLIGIILLTTEISGTISVLVLIILTAIFIVVVFNERIFKKVTAHLLKRTNVLKKVLSIKEINTKEAAENLFKPVAQVKNFRTFSMVTFLSILIWASIGFQAYLILVAMGVNSGAVQTTVIMAMGTLVGLIPITLSGLGVREGAFAFFMSFIGVPLNVGVSASIIAYIIGQIPPTVVGLLIYITQRARSGDK